MSHENSAILADWAELKSRARTSYERMEHVWPPTDPWSSHTKSSIAEFIRRVVPDENLLVLNAGCGGNDYGLSAKASCVNLDISLRQCRDLPSSVVGDVESIPFAGDHFDVTVCVGAVINYVRPATAIPELIRVTKPGGLILLDFESSRSAELLFTSHWGKRISVVERLYVDRMDKTYLFTRGQIRRIVEESGAATIASGGYHSATAIWERIFKVRLIPRWAFSIDAFASRVPGIRALASSLLLACRKN